VWCGFLSERHEEIKGAGPVVSQQQIRGPTTVHALGYEGPQLLYNASPMTPPLVKVSVHAESEETTRKSPRKLNLAIQISRVWCNFYPGLHKTQEPHDRCSGLVPSSFTERSVQKIARLYILHTGLVSLRWRWFLASIQLFANVASGSLPV
jgi:hypothetical protein